MVVVLYSVWRFRMKPGEEDKDGPPIHGNTRLEIIWTAIPAIILVALCSYAYVVLTDIEDAAGRRAERARRSASSSPGPSTTSNPDGGEEVASPQLYVPRGQHVHFTVQSKDVIHDFWVPAFRMKIDAVPGVDTHLRVTPKTVGQYPVVCAELCGLGHAVMRQTAHVVEPDDFDAWLTEPRREGEGGGDEEQGGERGRRRGRGARRQGSLHRRRLRRLPRARGRRARPAAPARTSTRASPGKDAAFIEESIVDPSAEIAEGFSDGLMPRDYGDSLQPAELDALVKYLAEVTK